MAIVKGRCVNIGSCTKAQKKETIEADENNFVCPECGRNLVKINARKTPPPPSPIRRWIIIIAVAVLVVLGILAFSLGWFGGKDSGKSETPETQAVESVEQESAETENVEDETMNAENQDAGEPDDVKEEDEKPEDVKKPVPAAKKTVFGGAATLSGNVITFARPYRINLHTLDKDYIEVPAGATIIACMFDGNYLIQGELVIQGESRLLSGIKEKL